MKLRLPILGLFIILFNGVFGQQNKGFELAQSLRWNVVKVNVIIANSSEVPGFGFIMGEKDDRLLVVTAFHLVDKVSGTEEESKILIDFFRSADPVEAQLIEYHDKDFDLALLWVPKPADFKWKKNCLAKVKDADWKGKKAWYIGKNEKWSVPVTSTPGYVQDVNKNKCTITLHNSRVTLGCSGGPMVSNEGIIGMVIKNDGVEDEVKVLSLECILRELIREEKYPINATTLPLPTTVTPDQKLQNGIFLNRVVPLFSLEVSGEYGFLFAKTARFQSNGAIGVSGHFNLLNSEKQLELGIGWQSPYRITTSNNFVTLDNQNVNVNTEYDINCNAYLSIRYTHSGIFNPVVRPTFTFATYFMQQELIANNNDIDIYQDELSTNNYINYRASIGVQLGLGRLTLQPNLYFSYFKANNINYEFDYFGWARPIIEKQNYFQFGMSLNIKGALVKKAK